jgi:tRNA pseudouridine38-40 synthase
VQPDPTNTLITDAMPDESNSSGIFRYALGVQYKGTFYCGWQRQDHLWNQSNRKSVQGELEAALNFVADEPVRVICAGRTDSGVHAYEQIVHFETRSLRPLKAWVLGVNSRLPDDISVLWAKQVPLDFHARFSARARTYHYWINNSSRRPAIWHELMTWVYQPLDERAMHTGGQFLLGENDFSSFRGASCQSRTPFRFMEKISVQRNGDLLRVEIRANAFLHHMVRNIVGTLLEVGRKEKPPEWLETLLALRDRRQAGVTAPSTGLYLMRVDYPDQYQLPQQESFPDTCPPW